MIIQPEARRPRAARPRAARRSGPRRGGTRPARAPARSPLSPGEFHEPGFLRGSVVLRKSPQSSAILGHFIVENDSPCKSHNSLQNFCIDCAAKCTTPGSQHVLLRYVLFFCGRPVTYPILLPFHVTVCSICQGMCSAYKGKFRISEIDRNILKIYIEILKRR